MSNHSRNQRGLHRAHPHCPPHRGRHPGHEDQPLGLSTTWQWRSRRSGKRERSRRWKPSPARD